MVSAVECTLPKTSDVDNGSKDFLFLRTEDKKQANSIKYKFVGQRVCETSKLAEFSLSDEASTKAGSSTHAIGRPRNCFIIMRTLVHSVVLRCLKRCDISSLTHVSAITSQLWGKNDGIFQLYFELLSQLEEHWHLNIYPEYRYHKVNKISRQLENKLVYQNMLNRMRFFTASSLSSKLEGILSSARASAADTAADAPAAPGVPLAADPVGSTYAYSSLSSYQDGVNHQLPSRQQNRPVTSSVEPATNRQLGQQQDPANVPDRNPFKTHHDRCFRPKSMKSDTKRVRKQRCTVKMQGNMCDRIKLGSEKKERRATAHPSKRLKVSGVTSTGGCRSPKRDTKSLCPITIGQKEDPCEMALDPSLSVEKYGSFISQHNQATGSPLRGDPSRCDVSSTALASVHASAKNMSSLGFDSSSLHSKLRCMVGTKQHLEVQDLYV
ncbi:hypothetical protein HG536_0D00170 [Torulaspora globosa]|uniref:A2 transcriptional factor n=1 Tax=Torulaspora globosa TaxID=48254 RepID=A0A7G3ZG59_9SACH|nr:uncharacterized protein HG536_0D00170 [Torulaspora globosa]QLL32495.1 hypothetical protein HG536_0D00170 [Torulaspora globosa]